VDVSASALIAKLQSEIASAALWYHRDVKAVAPENFHFTLMFLGEITEAQVAEIQSVLSSISFAPIEITYAGVGAFPRPDAARVVWVGVDKEGSRKLTELARKVVEAVEEVGYTPDKPFSPHLTIFRVKSTQTVNVTALVKKYDGVFASDTVDRVHLKKSDLTPTGPIYSNVYTIQAVK
jgi:2'-5' RNA ligase